MSNSNPFSIAAQKPRIAGTGLISLDIVINTGIDHLPQHWVGGTCGNVLTISSYLGWNSYPVARLNGDTASECVLQDLLKWGVNLEFAKSTPGAETPIIIHKIGRNAAGKAVHKFSLNCPYCGAWLPTYKPVTAQTAESVAARLENPKVFFMDRVSRGSLNLAKASAEKGAVIVFEPSGIGNPDHFLEALSLTHILKYSEERMDELSELKPSRRPLIEIETLGQSGLRYRSKIPDCKTNGWQRLNAFDVAQVKDTAGAGDWCTAGIIHFLCQGGLSKLNKTSSSKLQDALRFGQALAAWNCKFEGSRGGMYRVGRSKFQEEVAEIMSQDGRRISTTYGLLVEDCRREISLPLQKQDHRNMSGPVVNISKQSLPRTACCF